MMKELEKEYAVAYSVYHTTDYEDFNFIEENREISNYHVNRLVNSVEEGYTFPPIIVDENMNVIDGQHRLKAHEQAGAPIQFIIQANMKEHTLQKANSDVVKWSTAQHVDYHVKQGNEHYQKLKDFKSYSEMPWSQSVRILGKSKDPKIISVAKILEYGLFEVKHEEDAYTFVDEVIMRIRMEFPTGKIISAIKNLYDAGADTKRLVTAINVTEDELMLLNTIPKIIETIVKVYNKDLKKSEQIKFTQYDSGQYRLTI